MPNILAILYNLEENWKEVCHWGKRILIQRLYLWLYLLCWLSLYWSTQDWGLRKGSLQHRRSGVLGSGIGRTRSDQGYNSGPWFWYCCQQPTYSSCKKHGLGCKTRKSDPGVFGTAVYVRIPACSTGTWCIVPTYVRDDVEDTLPGTRYRSLPVLRSQNAGTPEMYSTRTIQVLKYCRRVLEY